MITQTVFSFQIFIRIADTKVRLLYSILIFNITFLKLWRLRKYHSFFYLRLSELRNRFLIFKFVFLFKGILIHLPLLQLSETIEFDFYWSFFKLNGLIQSRTIILIFHFFMNFTLYLLEVLVIFFCFFVLFPILQANR